MKDDAVDEVDTFRRIGSVCALQGTFIAGGEIDRDGCEVGCVSSVDWVL